MMRWLLLLLFVGALGVTFRTHSPLILGIALVVALVSFIGTVFGFISARVDSVASGQSSRELDLLLAQRAREAKGQVPANAQAPQPGGPVRALPQAPRPAAARPATQAPAGPRQPRSPDEPST